MPQLGAVLVPMNYRLTADDFVYMVNHSGSTVLCVHSDYLDAIDAVRDQMPGVRHFVAFEGGAGRDGWLDYEALIAATGPAFARPEIGERDLLTINYTSGTTSRPKGVMITHRNACDEHHRHAAAPAHGASATATCGRCRCSTPTGGRSPGR